MVFRTIFILLAFIASARAQTRPARIAWLDNGILRAGVYLDRGGSIGYIADVKKGGSVVNIHDLGRWIGQSYYAGPRPFGEAHPAWKNWPWNPVSAGDVYGNPSRLVEQKNNGKSMYIKSVPMQWALKNVPGECTFETWLELDTRCIHVRSRLTNARSDRTQYRAMDQEVPFVYTIGSLHRVVTYTGDRPFTSAAVQEIPPHKPENGRPKWSTFYATEHWAALVNEDNWGLGVIHPGVVRFIGGFVGKTKSGGPEDDSTGYVSPVRQEILDHNIVYEYRYTLVLDTVENIRKEALRQRPASPLPDYRFKSDRQHWWYQNMHDAGQPIQGCLRLNVEGSDPHMFGPEGAWNAADAPTIYIRAAFRTKHTTAEVYWETADAGFSGERKVQFTIIPDGVFRTYEVKLSGSPDYRGTIRRFRFDPVPAAGPGETVEVEFISAKKE